MAVKPNQKMVKLLRKKIVSISAINDDNKPPYPSFIKICNYHGNQRKHVCLERNFCMFTKRNKTIQKIK